MSKQCFTDNSLKTVLNFIREFSPQGKSHSENSVQTVLIEHSVQTVINVIS